MENQEKIKKYTAWAFFIIITLAFLYLIHGLLQPIFFGAVFAIVLFPLYKKIKHRLRGRENPAAFLSILSAIVILVIGGYFVGGFLVNDALVLFEEVSQQIDEVLPYAQGLLQYIQDTAPPILAEQLTEENIRNQVVAFSQNVVQGILGSMQTLTGNLIQIILFGVIMFYSTFYFLKFGNRWTVSLFKALPFPDDEEKYISQTFADMTRTALKMVFVMGAVQGFLGGLIFAILGLPAPFFFGLLFALLSLIPGIGHPVIWLPTAIILFATGQIVTALILVAYGALVMGLADDLLRPYLIGRKVKINPYLILIATIGGIATLGFVGLILGPIVAALAMLAWRLHQRRLGTIMATDYTAET